VASGSARQLAEALNAVTAHRHPAHDRPGPDCTCSGDPLRYLLDAGAGSPWRGEIDSVVASRGRVLALDDYLRGPVVELHVVRLGNGDAVERSADGVWRAGGDHARHRITSGIRTLSRSAAAWIIFSVFAAAVLAGLIVMFAHTAQTISH
jgi:hypothetical protein